MLRLITIGVLIPLLTACASLLMPSADRTLAELPPGDYRLDPAHTRILFKIDHLGISSYIGRLNHADASLTFDPSAPEQARLNATVDMHSLDVNDTDFAADLMSCNWLCAERFPEARFKTTGSTRVEGETLYVPGELFFRGHTHPLELVVILRGGVNNPLTGDYTLGFDAHLTFQRSEFGMDRYIPMVGDEVRIEIYTEFF